VVTELWTPAGVTDYSVAPAGRNAETGGQIESHLFQVKDPVTGKQNRFCVLTDENTSQAHLEDMVAQAVEKWLTEVRAESHKPPPTSEQRKEIGRILDDIRVYRAKRTQSSNGLIYYSGIGGSQ
jgi:hypothetical protein